MSALSKAGLLAKQQELEELYARLAALSAEIGDHEVPTTVPLSTIKVGDLIDGAEVGAITAEGKKVRFRYIGGRAVFSPKDPGIESIVVLKDGTVIVSTWAQGEGGLHEPTDEFPARSVQRK